MRALIRWMVFFSLIGLMVVNLDRQALPGEGGAPVEQVAPAALPQPGVIGVAPPPGRLAVNSAASISDAFWLGVVLALVVMLMIVYLRWAVFEPGRQGG